MLARSSPSVVLSKAVTADRLVRDYIVLELCSCEVVVGTGFMFEGCGLV